MQSTFLSYYFEDMRETAPSPTSELKPGLTPEEVKAYRERSGKYPLKPGVTFEMVQAYREQIDEQGKRWLKWEKLMGEAKYLLETDTTLNDEERSNLTRLQETIEKHRMAEMTKYYELGSVEASSKYYDYGPQLFRSPRLPLSCQTGRPLESTIRLPCGWAPSVPSKLTRAVGVLA